VKRSEHRILTTHVGSLIRPPELVEFLRRRQRQEPYDSGAYERCLAESVAAAVRQQAQTGVDVVSDGEFGKSISWSQYVLERLSGFESRPSAGLPEIYLGQVRDGEEELIPSKIGDPDVELDHTEISLVTLCRFTLLQRALSCKHRPG